MLREFVANKHTAYHQRFDSWEEVRDFITAFHLDPFYDDYNYSIVGIVVN